MYCYVYIVTLKFSLNKLIYNNYKLPILIFQQSENKNIGEPKVPRQAASLKL